MDFKVNNLSTCVYSYEDNEAISTMKYFHSLVSFSRMVIPCTYTHPLCVMSLICALVLNTLKWHETSYDLASHSEWLNQVNKTCKKSLLTRETWRALEHPLVSRNECCCLSQLTFQLLTKLSIPPESVFQKHRIENSINSLQFAWVRWNLHQIWIAMRVVREISSTPWHDVIFYQEFPIPWLILGLRSDNERRRYFVTTTLIGWTQA